MKFSTEGHILEPLSWQGGPTLMVHLRFQGAGICECAGTYRRMLEEMRIVGPFRQIEDVSCGNPDHIADPPRKAYGLWQIQNDRPVGVLLVLVSDFEVRLCIPPRHVETVFPPFPWSVSGWVPSAATRSLHEKLMDCISRLRRVIPVQGVLIQDEAWLCGLKANTSGVFIASELAEEFGGVKRLDSFVSLVPFPSA
jgi:hypothetical protein